ncbi:hypothetical protein GW17_00055657 [Ensete ventricosum]|nr:hypothetical protein GW17_00055657 [Ensete ventricosum]RZR85659.1 hypothetical protein BHM03_00012678 [Ensete ventricosum]
MAMEGQRDAKNAALRPSVRTLADSKLGGDLYRGSASLELYRGSASLELYRGSLLQSTAQRLHKRLFNS